MNLQRRSLAQLLALAAAGPLAASVRASSGTVLTPQQVGVAGTGQGDDSDALQALLDRAADIGAELHLPPGVYRISRYLVVRHGVRAILGRGGVLQCVPGQLNAGLLLAGRSHRHARNVAGLRIEGLVIDAGARRQPVNAIHGLNCRDCRIVGNHIVNLHAGSGVLIHSQAEGGEAATDNHILENRIEGDLGIGGTEWWGIRLNAPPRFAPGINSQDQQWLTHGEVADAVLPVTGQVVRDNTVSGGYYGIWLMAARNCTVQGNRLAGQVRNLSVQDASCGNLLADNHCLESLSSAIHLAYGAADNTVRGNRVHTRRGEGEGLLQAYVAVHGNRFVDNQVLSEGRSRYLAYCGVHASGNVFESNLFAGRASRAGFALESAWDGYGLQSAHYGFLKGPRVTGFARGASQGNQLLGNQLRCSDADAPALFLAQWGDARTGLSDTRVQDNRVIAPATAPLLVLHEAWAGGLTGLQLQGNRFDVIAPANRFVLPRGAAHFSILADNGGLDRWLKRPP